MATKKQTSNYSSVIQTIKSAILKSRYRAAVLANREMLSLYYGIGKYISENSRKGFWGTGAIETISGKLQQELPGLRGFSAANIRKMRIFFEKWAYFITNRSPVANDLQNNLIVSNRQLPTDEIQIDLLTVNRQPLADDLQINLIDSNRPLSTDDLEELKNINNEIRALATYEFKKIMLFSLI